MPSTTPGVITLNGKPYVILDETYSQQLQTPFNPRFSTGQPNVGDLTFFQFISMADWSGGNGQEIFEGDDTNKFFDSERIDVTESGKLKLAPQVEFVTSIRGPENEAVQSAVEQEDAWPQIIEWLGQAIVFNDTIDHDDGGLGFLEVYDTTIIADEVISTDTSGQAGDITNDTRAEIVEVSKYQGLPGDTFTVTVKYKKPNLHMAAPDVRGVYGDAPEIEAGIRPVRFRLDFGGSAEYQSDSFSKQDITFERADGQLEFQPGAGPGGAANYVSGDAGEPGVPHTFRFIIDQDILITFVVKVPDKAPGIYQLWTSCAWQGYPFSYTSDALAGVPAVFQDGNCNASFKFFIQSVDTIPVTRKNLYAPQLKAATVVGSKLVGFRTVNSIGYVEVYQKQNEAVDRTLQLSLSTATLTNTNPTYCELIGSNGVVIAAFDNKIYKIDIETSGLTVAQRFTFIGSVPGSYVSGLAIWNQRVYILSFDKSEFTSHITWTDLTVIEGSYAIDGKFWGTDLANFQGALFYSGGTQDGIGQVRLYPSAIVAEVEHPSFDARVRSLNAGRFLYFGHPHATGLGVITDRGASNYAEIDLGDGVSNIVWDIEEVGNTVFFLARNGIYKTNQRYQSNGFLDSSRIGGNTPLIDKIWSSITVETEQLDGAHTIRLYITSAVEQDEQWTSLGEMTKADGLKKEFVLPQGFFAPWIRYRIELITTDDTKTPVVKSVMVKYVPTAINKWQWAFGILAYDNLLLMDKIREKRRGSEIMNDLLALRGEGVIQFVDVDETQYDVIITDIRKEHPLIDKGSLEAVVMLELLEA